MENVHYIITKRIISISNYQVNSENPLGKIDKEIYQLIKLTCITIYS